MIQGERASECYPCVNVQKLMVLICCVPHTNPDILLVLLENETNSQ